MQIYKNLLPYIIDTQKSEEWRVTLKDRKSAKRVPPIGASADTQKHEEQLSARGMYTLYLDRT